MRAHEFAAGVFLAACILFPWFPDLVRAIT